MTGHDENRQRPGNKPANLLDQWRESAKDKDEEHNPDSQQYNGYPNDRRDLYDTK